MATTKNNAKSNIKGTTNKRKTTTKKNTSTGISKIYCIKQNDKVIYIGSTDREIDKRFSEHQKSLEKGKHTNKSLQKAYDKDDNFTYDLLVEIPTDNTLVKFFTECLVNSIYSPVTNKCIISQGRMRIILQRCDKGLAQEILDCVIGYYDNKKSTHKK